MGKVLCVYLPMWPIDRLRRRLRRQSRPTIASRATSGRRPKHLPPPSLSPAILLVRTMTGRQIVTHGCELCLTAGVTPGVTAAQARALLPVRCEVIQQEHEPEHDCAALHRLAQWAIRFTPVVAVDEPDGLMLDITGCESIYHGEDRLRERIWKAINAIGLRCQVATGPTPGSAWALAHYGGQPIADVQRGDLHGALADLPIRALRLEDSTCEALREVAIDRIGHLFPLARKDVAQRFGGELMLRLDQALGEAVEYIEPIRPADPVEVEYALAGPTTQSEAITALTKELLGQVCNMLENRESGARAITLRLDRGRHDAPVILAISLSRPSRCPRHLWTLLAHQVENANLGDGVEGMRLTVARCDRIAHIQSAIACNDGQKRWAAQEDDAMAQDRIGELVDVLSTRLGAGNVLCADLVQSHIPTRAFAYQEAASVPPGRGKAWEVVGQWPDRPTRLLFAPEPIEVIALTPDGPPVRVHWRGMDHAIYAYEGPERIACEWWRNGSRASPGMLIADCDYFKVALPDGRCLWMRRDNAREGAGGGTGRWSLVGMWT